MKKFVFRFLICINIMIILAASVGATAMLVPGGQVVGLELQDDTVTVVAIDAQLGTGAAAAGLEEGDRILRIDKCSIKTASDVQKALTSSDGKVEVTVLRSGKTKNLQIRPAVTAQGPKLGVYLKQGTTGLGTITYYQPETGCFGALGHGVNNPSGSLLPMRRGSVYPAGVFSVNKGKIGTPGQLLGALEVPVAMGNLEKNTQQGVFGVLQTPITDEPLPVATIDQVKTGKATIRSTISGDTLKEYSVEILKIYPNSRDRCRNFLLKVTDPTLLSQTGGIVQGMSGSPIIQDGKLVGAVTHVLVNDPTTGYGIFIENMLDAAA